MSKNENKKGSELDIAGLLALKAFELPDPERVEKKLQNIMREVRTAHKNPSLLLFPDKSAAGMFAQPRYGVAALFILFLGLHLLERPLPKAEIGRSALVEAAAEAELTVAATVATNQATAPSIPHIAPAYRPVAGDIATFVNYTE